MDPFRPVSYAFPPVAETITTSPEPFSAQLFSEYTVTPGSLFDLTLEKFYSDEKLTKDPETEERLIRTIWFHLFQLRNSKYSTHDFYREILDRFKTNTLTAEDKQFFTNQEQGWIPSAKSLGRFLHLISVPPTAKYADVRWNVHYLFDTVSGGEWDLLPDGARRRKVIYLYENPRYLKNTDPYVEPVDTSLPKRRNHDKHDAYVLLVPRSGALFDTDGVFDCLVVLLALEKVEVTFYEYIEADGGRNQSQSVGKVFGNPVYYDLEKHEFYIENQTSAVFVSEQPHKVPRGEMERYGGTYSERLKIFGKPSQSNQKVQRMYSEYYWSLLETLHRKRYPLEEALQMGTEFREFNVAPEIGMAWTERMEYPECKYPYDMYLLHFDTLENNPDLRWLHFLLRYQQKWRAMQEAKHNMRPPGRRTLEVWPGLLGPHFNFEDDVSFAKLPPPHPGYIDKSTATDERIQERPKRLMRAPSSQIMLRTKRKK